MLSTESFKHISTFVFLVAILHTFFTGKFNRMANKYREGSVRQNFLHLLGEVEIVFGLWSGVLIVISFFLFDFNLVMGFLNERNFTEAIFVFVVMSICSTRPILAIAERALVAFSKVIPLDGKISSYLSILFLGPLLGSFITEPAAMTICAFLLLPRFFTSSHSLAFKYATIALLFFNVSLGGTLTPYAAPPVLMVAHTWQWDLAFMLNNFAPQTVFILLVNTLLTALVFRKEIVKGPEFSNVKLAVKTPIAVTIIHLIFLFLIVASARYSVLFVGLFLFLIGFMRATREYQSALNLREPLLVSFFLAGLVVLGGTQEWWITPIISSLSKHQLFFGSIGLTAFVDNAALTYLGSLVPSLDHASKLALVRGSVIGGGLTLIANAPNPVGFGILRNAFEEDGFSQMRLLVAGLPLVIFAIIIFF
jgi:Na+/H+ antiporter NhaD/arsenite permease-like protein